jgi:hypothetical protein
MHVLAIIALCVLVACGYGIVHDQITARVCIEYFTIGHPQLFAFPTQSPTLLGFAWGIVATWWVGVGLGVPLAAASRLGPRVRKSAGELIKPLMTLAAITGILAVVAGVISYALGSAGWIKLSGPWSVRVPQDKHTAFLADLFAHNMSYFAGTVGGIVLAIKTWRSREPG